MWYGTMWQGLLRWWSEDQSAQHELAIRRAARRTVRALLRPERLSNLDVEQFGRLVAPFGRLRRADGAPVEAEHLQPLSAAQLEQLLDSGEIIVTGNRLVGLEDGVCPATLSGLAGAEELREFLARLLDPGGGGEEAVQRAACRDAPIGAPLATAILCICSPRPRGVWDRTRTAGLQRLAELLEVETQWSGVHRDYARYTEVLDGLRERSMGVLSDPLALDLMLCRLAELRRPRPWKIAVGLGRPQPEAEAIALRCLEEGFAAIAPEEPDDPNIARLRQLVPGDCVVMHLRGRVGAVGRVTRPYYEFDRSAPDLLDRSWWRRIDVDWIPGDHDYGSLLSGAQQRFSVVELERPVFWAIARMYRHDPRYDRLIRPLRGAWVLTCDARRREMLTRLGRPLPLRDRWALRFDDDPPEPGDQVFLCSDGRPGGIFAHARVLSEAKGQPDQKRGTLWADVLYERVLDHPLTDEDLSADPRMSSWRLPDDGSPARLNPQQTAAVREMMDLPSERHFVLLAGGSDGRASGPEATYRVGGEAGGDPAKLADAVSHGAAKCLIHHGSPEHAFVGFGEVVCLRGGHAGAREAGTMEIHIAPSRFPQTPGGHSLRRRLLKRRAATPRQGPADRWTHTVLPVSAFDFYRVVGAGMGTAVDAEPVASLQALAEECGAAPETLAKIERLLREKGQMILYGPPGTGKTWVALRLASYLAGGDDARMEVVQFHPAYTYEDFIEGIRPQVVESDGGRKDIEYPLVPGSFMSFCARARRDSQRTYVFVVDEMNRAQVAQVFGELMLALEYREREVGLAHARSASDPEGRRRHFSVPRNVLLLATMNTADRSTALVDHALRRRFVFFPLFPDDDELVRPMFERWLAGNAPEMAWVAHLLASINERLEPELGRHLLIGPSYFMRPGLTEELLREVWRYQLMPLLEEYFAGMPDRLAQFDLEELMREARSRHAAQEHAPDHGGGPYDRQLELGVGDRP